MMMAGDKKKAITLIINKMKDKSYDGMKESNEKAMEAPQNEMGDEVDNSMGLNAAAEEMMSAMERKDASAFAAALKSFMEMCDYEEPESED